MAAAAPLVAEEAAGAAGAAGEAGGGAAGAGRAAGAAAPKVAQAAEGTATASASAGRTLLPLARSRVPGRSGGGRGGGRGGGGRQADDSHNNDAPSFLERLWSTQISLDLFDRIKGKAESILDKITAPFLPTYTEEVVVNVFGGKGSSFAGLYFMALSAAWGAVNPSPTFGAAYVVKTYVNRTARHVMVRIVYSTRATLSTSIGVISAGVLNPSGNGLGDILNSYKIFMPPGEQVTGKPWNPKLSVVAELEQIIAQLPANLIQFFGFLFNIPANAQQIAKIVSAARLGDFRDVVIATTSDDFAKLKQNDPKGDYYELNPSPTMDGITRDSDITAIITQGLWDPELENPPDPKTNFRYKVGAIPNGRFGAAVGNPLPDLINQEVSTDRTLTLPEDVLDLIDDDQPNQTYTGKPMDPPNKTQ